MNLPTDVNVYKAGYSVEVYRDMSQYLACEKSIEMLKSQMQDETEYGPGYLALLQARIDSARAEMAALEAKYEGWVNPESN